MKKAEKQKSGKLAGKWISQISGSFHSLPRRLSVASLIVATADMLSYIYLYGCGLVRRRMSCPGTGPTRRTPLVHSEEGNKKEKFDTRWYEERTTEFRQEFKSRQRRVFGVTARK